MDLVELLDRLFRGAFDFEVMCRDYPRFVRVSRQEVVPTVKPRVEMVEGLERLFAVDEIGSPATGLSIQQVIETPKPSSKWRSKFSVAGHHV